jgi:predicted alpha/beta superfamily hydrolase
MVTARAVQLPGSEVHVLHSDAVGDDFEISVFEPPAGVLGSLPVVYCTDANNRIGTPAEIVRGLQTGAEIPPVRLVCVGTSEIVGMDVRGGGADAFLEFLTNELQPWIAANYDVSDDTTLIGNSMGGLFATYTLFHRPASFRRYVIGSPWLTWNRDVSTSYEAAYAANHNDLDATVFLAAGADEEVLPPAMPEAMLGEFRGADTAELTRQLGAALETRGYPSLRVTTRIFPEQTHFTMGPIMLAHGLRNVFTAEREAG